MSQCQYLEENFAMKAPSNKADHVRFIRNLHGLSGDSVSNVDSCSVEDEINRLDNCIKCGKGFLTKTKKITHKAFKGRGL